MATADHRTYLYAPHPLHAILLASPVPLFLGALLSDWAYSSSYQIQWNNFASWLIAGALVFTGLAILCGLISLLRFGRRRAAVISLLLLVVTWILGFINALIHAKDAWASMPGGLVLSVVVFVLICVATWFGLMRERVGGGV
ncbi:membrane protein [Pseudomonas saudimassiliensis]|uniref:Membrane protein n=1 Tax=Pseudomonas saudimassiliensis TaxID=1461581 RepID=A0A078MDW7_9PSED|nr:DUF2231 domain-containing protein [Pseudomonas saudimassiliensis]CEA04419.1 membrane protein [Pseudomonas saudimassiliensis]CEF26614.1 membrane protein [Pseudomonas saudimassiliensis]